MKRAILSLGGVGVSAALAVASLSPFTKPDPCKRWVPGVNFTFTGVEKEDLCMMAFYLWDYLPCMDAANTDAEKCLKCSDLMRWGIFGCLGGFGDHPLFNAYLDLGEVIRPAEPFAFPPISDGVCIFGRPSGA